MKLFNDAAIQESVVTHCVVFCLVFRVSYVVCVCVLCIRVCVCLCELYVWDLMANILL